VAARVAGAAEDKRSEARRLYDEATAAFGVGSYAEAAEKYKASFKLHPEPALLYNAAQAYRMAGNRQRALPLYRNFVRLYGGNPRAEDARNHAAALEGAMNNPVAGPRYYS
jgi:outer membrane protein assembly factor BamD (BamD/ComL family)